MQNNYISLNISHLIDIENIGKDAFGELFGLNRGAISSYIHGKAIPKIETLQKISEYYKISLDDLINTNLSKGNIINSSNNKIKGNNIQISNGHGTMQINTGTLTEGGKEILKENGKLKTEIEKLTIKVESLEAQLKSKDEIIELLRGILKKEE